MDSENELFYIFFETKNEMLEYWLKCDKDRMKCKACDECYICYNFNKINKIIQRF